MNAHELALYEAAKKELDRVYQEVSAVRGEFKQLIADMASQLLAEEVSS